MDKTLLIVSDFNLRQLYHELLFSRTLEVIPISSISSAIVLLSLEDFPNMIMRIDDNISEAEVFLSLRKKHPTWLKSKIFLLTSCLELGKNLDSKDFLINTHQLPPDKIISKIKSEI